MPDQSLIQYLKRLWNVVALRALIDAAIATFLLAIIGLLAVGFVGIAGSELGVTVRHVRRALSILGWVYILMIWLRAFYRHWIIAGQASPERRVIQPVTSEEAHVQSPTPSN